MYKQVTSQYEIASIFDDQKVLNIHKIILKLPFPLLHRTSFAIKKRNVHPFLTQYFIQKNLLKRFRKVML